MAYSSRHSGGFLQYNSKGLFWLENLVRKEGDHRPRRGAGGWFAVGTLEHHGAAEGGILKLLLNVDAEPGVPRRRDFGQHTLLTSGVAPPTERHWA